MAGYSSGEGPFGDSADYDVEEMLDEWFELYEDDPTSPPSVEDLWPDCPPSIADEVARRIEALCDVQLVLNSISMDTQDNNMNHSILCKGYRPISESAYELVKRLDDGESGFGEVWMAYNERRKRHGVFKFCKKPEDPDKLLTLHNELRLAQELDHPEIVKLEEEYLDHEIPCLRYEYVEGVDFSNVLHEHFTRFGALPPVWAATIILKLADIFGYAHSHKSKTKHKLEPVVHRDVKPQNILVANCQELAAFRELDAEPDLRLAELKVMDFGIGGIARFGKDSTTAARSVGRKFDGWRTPKYASPEQAEGSPSDPTDDVFSLGVIWYELLVGQMGHGSPSGSLDYLQEEGLSEEQVRLLESCLRPRRHRIPDGNALAKAIRAEYPETQNIPTLCEELESYMKRRHDEGREFIPSANFAKVLAGCDVDCIVFRLSELTEDAAAELAKFQGKSIDFYGLRTPPINVLEALSHFDGYLSMECCDAENDRISYDHLKSLSRAAARTLAKLVCFSLNGLPSLSQEVAAELTGCAVTLKGLTELSVEVAKLLGEVDELRLTTPHLSRESAAAIACLEAQDIELQGFARLPEEVARVLVTDEYWGALTLCDVTSLSHGAVEALAACNCECLSLPKVTSLSGNDVEALVMRIGYERMCEVRFGSLTEITGDHSGLLLAVQLHDTYLVSALLSEANVDSDEVDTDGRTALFYVSSTTKDYNVFLMDDEEWDNATLVILKMLEEHGANVNHQANDGSTPLHMAASKGDDFATKTLLDMKADPRVKNAAGQTPLDVALAAGYPEIAVFILNTGLIELTRDVAAVLADIDTVTLDLKGLTGLGVGAAAALANFRGSKLYLNSKLTVPETLVRKLGDRLVQ